MKKIRFLFQGNRYCYLKKFLLVMKLSTFLLIISIASYGATGYSQPEHVSVKLKDAKLKEFFSVVEHQTPYKFLYRDDAVEKIVVNLDESDKPLDQVLDNVLPGAGLSYKILTNNLVVIASKEILQEKPVTGNVTDAETGEPLPGVYVLLKGTTTGVITGVDGNYSIKVPDTMGTLVFSSIGYTTQEIPVKGRTSISVQLAMSNTALDEVVVIGYGTQKKANISGAVAAISGVKLSVTPAPDISLTLAGQLPGLVTKNEGGLPGYNSAKIQIRNFGLRDGTAALYILDGVEVDPTVFNDLHASEIESVSVLKDASAAIYGARAGNGVILINTKRGKDQKPVFELTTSYIMNGVQFLQRPSSSSQMASYSNEVWKNQGSIGTAPYTAEQIQKYADGSDPDYPNSNWVDFVTKKYAPASTTSLSVRGGTAKVRYFGLFGYRKESTFIKVNGGDAKRFNFRSNVDADITDNFNVQFDLSGSLKQSRFSYRIDQGGNWFQDLYGSDPRIATSNPNGSLPNNLVLAESNRANSGIHDQDYDNLFGSLALNYKVKQIKGLSARLFANYHIYTHEDKNFGKTFSMYTYNYGTETYSPPSTIVGDGLSQGFSKQIDHTINYSLKYEHTFANDHNLQLLVLGETRKLTSYNIGGNRKGYLDETIQYLNNGSSTGQTNYGSAGLPLGRASWLGRLNYDYKSKYLLDVIVRRDASSTLAPDARWGTFPSVSVAWRLSEEDFIKNNIPAFDNLKLRGSIGQVGLDYQANYNYLGGYTQNVYNIWDLGAVIPNYGLGNGLSMVGILPAATLPNPKLTWQTITMKDIGLEFSLLKGKINGEFDLFNRRTDDIVGISTTVLPSNVGAQLPPQNLNSAVSKGFEFVLGTRGSSNDLAWDITGNICYSREKWDKFAEALQADPDVARIKSKSGQYIDNIIGYKSDGLFTTQAQIDAAPKQINGSNDAVKIGDIKLLDLNGDDKIDFRDQAVIGKGSFPHSTFALNNHLSYKNFDFVANFSGAFGYSFFAKYFGPTSKDYLDNRWTEENNDHGKLIPRPGSSNPNNSLVSDHYVKNAAYVRLKTLSLGYTIPEELTKKVSIQGLRIYASGYNLLTVGTSTKYYIDPEGPYGQVQFYPVEYSIQFGIQVTF
jgi:TonB-linked SusC/RagA family outer membrane protein